MKHIPLTQGKFAIVDDKDFEELSKYKWFAYKGRHTFYASRTVFNNGKRTTIRMHRQILGLSKDDGKQTDHRNGNGLDNGKNNLRECTNKQNQHNRRIQGGASQYKGVHWHKKTGKWRASIRVDRKLKHLGLFDNEIEAAKVYDAKAKEIFGEFARTNF